METPIEALDLALTPNDRFFVRSHFDPPAEVSTPLSLRLSGEIANPATLSLRDLQAMETSERLAVLQCAGNGRAFHTPPVAGIQWEKGAIGNARWQGVPLARLLERVRPAATARHVHLIGADRPPHPATPPFLRSIPIERAMDGSTLVAWHMNGEPLPRLHGGPFRLVVPGWAGNHWMKWLVELRLSPLPATGFFMDTAYQMPLGGGSGSYAPLTLNPVKSWITTPLDGARVGGGPLEIAGHAMSGTGPIRSVEISTDGGATFASAEVDPLETAGSWQRWRFVWRPTRGRHVLAVKATDSAGTSQPRTPSHNRSGYFWNGWDTIAVEAGT